MSKKKLNLELVTPEALLFSEDIDMVVVPGDKGDFGVLPEHSPLVAMLRPGIIAIYNNSEDNTKKIFVTTGYADVSSKQCTILAEEAINIEDITSEMVTKRSEDALRALKKAETELDKQKAEHSKLVAEAMKSLIAEQAA